jgi:hypothetical protein
MLGKSSLLMWFSMWYVMTSDFLPSYKPTALLYTCVLHQITTLRADPSSSVHAFNIVVGIVPLRTQSGDAYVPSNLSSELLCHVQRRPQDIGQALDIDHKTCKGHGPSVRNLIYPYGMAIALMSENAGLQNLPKYFLHWANAGSRNDMETILWNHNFARYWALFKYRGWKRCFCNE